MSVISTLGVTEQGVYWQERDSRWSNGRGVISILHVRIIPLRFKEIFIGYFQIDIICVSALGNQERSYEEGEDSIDAHVEMDMWEHIKGQNSEWRYQNEGLELVTLRVR